MKSKGTLVSAISAVAIVIGSLGAQSAVADVVEEGREIAFDRKKGNCLACHAIDAKGASLPGNIGPPLKNIKDRFASKEKLRAQIYDATVNNPNTIMPPFGRHNILSGGELDKVVEFIYSL
ncbi:MAG: sulfur oxidation c-type cytochrome SoxX [Gammaproteobacteria bacterium]|nr:sulfur oxidation c-type cytochrome SoxX [Gammaproteobacteria bacterium]